MKIIRKWTALVLAMIVAISLPAEVNATPQNPVTRLDRTSEVVKSNSLYSFTLHWDQPLANTDGPNLAGYRIYWRNTSAQENYNDTRRTDPIASGALNRRLTNMSLEDGSLYAFRVTPYHQHDPIYDNDTGELLEIPPPEEGIKPNGPEFLFLTDIKVTGYGRIGNPDNGIPSQITVTWDNPTLGNPADENSRVFDAYRIAYAFSDGTGGPTSAGSFDIDVTDERIVQINNGRQLEFTFDIQNGLAAGEFYDITVEPLRNRSLFRNQSGTINVNGVEYLPFFTENKYLAKIAVSIPINIIPLGGSQLLIDWEEIGTRERPVSIEVQYSTDIEFKSPLPTSLGKLVGQDTVQNVTHWLTESPKVMTYYRLKITYAYEVNGEPYTLYSEVAEYNPHFNKYLPYTPTIDTFQSTGDPLMLDVKWEAFIRDPYTPEEAANLRSENGMYLDLNLDYYVLITDSLMALEQDSYPPYSIVTPIDAFELTPEYNPVNKKFYFSQRFDGYYSLDATGRLNVDVKLPLEENKIYYVRIIAMRTDADDGDYLLSRYSYASCFVPPSGDISVTPQMASKPPLNVENVTIDSITIGWDRRWYEAYKEPEPGKPYNEGNWFTLIGWNDEGEVFIGEEAEACPHKFDLFGSIADSSEHPPFTNLKSSIKARMERETQLDSGAIADLIDKIPFRYVDLGPNALYEVHVTTYEEMKRRVGDSYEDYLNIINAVNPPGWVEWRQTDPLNEGSDTIHQEFTIWPDEPLDENTAYVIFFRPYYVIDGMQRHACYPIYLNATTLKFHEDLIPKPIIPLLEPDGQTDMSVTVKWEYSTELIYELEFAEVPPQYIGIAWETIDIEAARLPRTPDGRIYLSYEILDLFPTTSYYIRIRSGYKPGEEAETIHSEWSNPIMMTTLDIEAPNPPKGLGLVSRESIANYNAENSSALERLGPNHMIIEWMKDYLDRSGHADSSDFPQVLPSSSYPDTYVTMVEELDPNTEYYIRVKTILTVSRVEGGRAQRVYNYFIQVAKDHYFDDIVGSGYVPAFENEIPDPFKDKRKESDWCATVTIKTGKSDGDYDTNVDDMTYPLPTQDFEVIYDPLTSALNLRFRTNKTDSAGNHDNSTDQRFISDLIANQTALYFLDLSNYNNQPVSTGSVELPYSIVKTFEDRRIPLRLKVGSITVDFMPGSLNTPDVLSLKDYGKDASVKISVTRNPGSAPALSPGEGYAGYPQNISVQVSSPSQTVNLSTLSSQMQVSLGLNGNYSMLDNNIGAYYADANSGGWQRIESNFSTGTGAGAMSFKTGKLANYAAIARSLPVDTELSRQSDASYNIMTNLDIRDMQTYNGSDPISANQLNNLIAAIAKGSSSLNINDSMSREDYESLGKSGYLITGTTVQRQVGINTLVRLYELKTKTAIKNYSDMRNSPYKDISLADQKYRDALLKAGDLGFFGTSAESNPHAMLTIADALYMVDIIMGDAGM